MNRLKFFFFVVFGLIAFAMSGCAVITYPDGSTRHFMLLQVGVIVRVVNNCAPYIDLERVDGIVVRGLPYGGSTTVAMQSTPFRGSNRRMPLTAKGYTQNREYLGSATREFHVSTYEGTREEAWEVDRLNLPGGRGGCR